MERLSQSIDYHLIHLVSTTRPCWLRNKFHSHFSHHHYDILDYDNKSKDLDAHVLSPSLQPTTLLIAFPRVLNSQLIPHDRTIAFSFSRMYQTLPRSLIPFNQIPCITHSWKSNSLPTNITFLHPFPSLLGSLSHVTYMCWRVLCLGHLNLPN